MFLPYSSSSLSRSSRTYSHTDIQKVFMLDAIKMLVYALLRRAISTRINILSRLSQKACSDVEQHHLTEA